MARFSGVELNDNWKVDYALTRIKGLGWSLVSQILEKIKVDGHQRVKALSADDVSKITAAIEEYPIEGDLIRKVRGDISRLQSIGAYRGVRHSRGLPTRGQRTRRNARTKRGKRKTVGAFKKEMLAKMTTPAK
jgi:small subunit ribosomal protein S13